jgi:predicted metal-binding membrane protein
MVASGRPSSPGSPWSGALRDRATLTTYALLLALAALAWAHVFLGMRVPGGHEAMPGMAGMPEMAGMSSASLRDGAVYVASWAVMMTAMMLPSALPMIGLYGAVQRKAPADGARGVHVSVFTMIYLAVWGATGVPVYLASVWLGAAGPALVSYGVALALIAAGVYQLSPLKQVCLRACRSPLGFLLGRWRSGRAGSLALAVTHALYCVGCCWALMVVLVVAGAMGLAWVLLIAALVAAEKLLPGGEWIARLAGGALVILGLAVAIRPDLLMLLRHGHMM